MRKILVTGAGGFIGRALCRFLAQKRGIMVLGIGRGMRPASFPGYHQLDLSNEKQLKAFLKKKRPGIIFHLAGGRSGGPSQLVDDNVLTTIHLLEAIRSLEGYSPRVLVPGTAAEYGDVLAPRRPILEKTPASPLGLYGWVKLLQTQTALHYAALGQDIIVARIFNILGEGIAQDLAPGKFAHDIAALEQSPQLRALSVGNLDGVRDFLDIRDICEALYALSLKGKSGEIYNICSQKGMVMRELLSGMIRTCGLSGIKIKENRKNKPGIMYAVGSNRKLRCATGWHPRYEVAQSLKDTLDFYRLKHGSV